MRIDDLRYFVAVAEHGHVGRAAHRLGVSQPALTKGVQRLEASLRLQLFERTSRGMVLTAVGSAFFDRAKNLCMELDDAVQEAADVHLGAIGTIRVGVSPPFADSLVGLAFARMLEQRPGAKVRVTIGLNDTLVNSLRLGDLDITVNALDDIEPEDLSYRALFNDPLRVVLREQHPLLLQQQLKLEHLAVQQWALPGPNVLARRRVETLFAERGLPAPDVVFQTDTSMTLVPSILRRTDLLGMLSDHSLRSQAGIGLVALEMNDTSWSRRIGVISRKGAYLSPLVQRYIDVLTERACELSA